MKSVFDLIIIGGGAAGFFAASQVIQKVPNAKVLILERGKDVLQKVKISGGGRCNVTNGCWDPTLFCQNYPRGAKELRGPMNRFCSSDIFGWMEDHGVSLHIESDGRAFPSTNSSQTIIDVLKNASLKKGVLLKTSSSVQSVTKEENWEIKTTTEELQSRYLLWASGSAAPAWKMIQKLGYELIKAVPSLFTFEQKTENFSALAGQSQAKVIASIPSISKSEEGPILFTHKGFSGPSILRLSAWGARELHDLNYKFQLKVNFTALKYNDAQDHIWKSLQENSNRHVANFPLFGLSKRLYTFLIGDEFSNKKGHEISRKSVAIMCDRLCKASYDITGKSTFKEEFVTAGGVRLDQINFKTMASKIHPTCYFSGEVLDIDAITGGFNFQAAWTTAFIASEDIAKKILST